MFAKKYGVGKGGLPPFCVYSPGSVLLPHCWASMSLDLHSSSEHIRKTLPFELVVPTSFGFLVHASGVEHACIPAATRLRCDLSAGEVITFFLLRTYEPGPATLSPSSMFEECTTLVAKSAISSLAISLYLRFY